MALDWAVRSEVAEDNRVSRERLVARQEAVAATKAAEMGNAEWMAQQLSTISAAQLIDKLRRGGRSEDAPVRIAKNQVAATVEDFDKALAAMKAAEGERQRARSRYRRGVAGGLIVLAALVGVILVVAMTRADKISSPRQTWFWLSFASIAGFAGGGWAATGRWFGILIDSTRNRVSLSKLQMFAWMILVVPAWATLTLVLGSVDVAIPVSVVAAFGLSLGSLTGASVIKSAKSDTDLLVLKTDYTTRANKRIAELKAEIARKESEIAEAGEADLAALKGKKTKLQDDLKKQEHELAGIAGRRDGDLYRNPDASEARLSDLFHGDEVSDRKLMKVSKIQMFYITVFVLIAYGVGLGEAIADRGSTLPEYSDTLLLLIGVSHVGYLTVKAAPK